MTPDNSHSAWHISLHFGGDRLFKTGTIQYKNRTVRIIRISSSELDEAFPVRFDQFIESINQMSGGYAEGDGSFGVVGPSGEWKICGTIYERSDSIQYAELMGHGPDDQLVYLAKLLGANQQQCCVQEMQGGFFQTLDQFLNSDSK